MKSALISYLFLSISLVSHAQSNQILNDYTKLPILGFFFPRGDKNKATYVNFNDKGNEIADLPWNRYYNTKEIEVLSDNENVKNSNNMHIVKILDEYMYKSKIVSSTMKSLLVTDKAISVIGENELVSSISKPKKTYTKSVILLAMPISRSISSEWQRIEDDGNVVTCISEFVDYKDGNQIIPCIKVKVTEVLASANRNTTVEYYYVYGYMASSIYNKTLKRLVLFEKMSNLTYDTKFDDEKLYNGYAKHKLTEPIKVVETSRPITPVERTVSSTLPKNVETVNNDALFKKSPGGGGFNGTVGKAAGTGGNNNGDEVGDKGNPNGKVNAKEFYGTPGGSSSGVAFDVSGWAMASRPIVSDDSDETGKIVFQINVNESGDITSVRQAQSTLSPSVTELYRRAVSRLRLRPKGGGATPPTATGTITFIIKQKE